MKEKAAMGGANGGKVNSAIKDPKKGKSTGCCGADGPCSIMWNTVFLFINKFS